MRLFGRAKGPAAPDPAAATRAIEEFWDWWHRAGAAQCAAAIAEPEPERLVGDLSGRVSAVHPGLAWELAAGGTARHRLVVTAEGDPTLRAVARRWLRAAPPADATWEYADLRQPVASLGDVTVSVGGDSMTFSDVVVAARRTGHAFDVTVHHPLFAGLPEQDRRHLTFLALDAALGEAAVETWVREIAPAAQAPLDAFALEHLPGLVRDLARECLDEDGEPTWVLLQGEGPAGPVLAAAQVPLSAACAPQLDTHVAVTVAFSDLTPEGFPGEGSLGPLRDLEDHLVARLGGSGRLVAHETSRGSRVLHCYVESGGPGVEVLRAAVGGWDQGPVAVHGEPDPGWRAVAHLRS